MVERGREGEKADGELKHTSATNDEGTFTSILLCGALLGFPQGTGTEERLQGDGAVRLSRETRTSECVPALRSQICHPSALCSVSCPFLFTAAVFVCRLSACGHGRPDRRRHVGGACLPWSPRGMSDQGKEVKKEGAAGFFRADSGGRGEQREVNATPGWFGSGPGRPNSAQEGH